MFRDLIWGIPKDVISGMVHQSIHPAHGFVNIDFPLPVTRKILSGLGTKFTH